MKKSIIILSFLMVSSTYIHSQPVKFSSMFQLAFDNGY